jgi:hypothetical protein
MSRKTNIMVAALLIAATSLALTDAGLAKPLRSRDQVHRPMRSAPVYLDQGHRSLQWGDPGYYNGWVPPPAHAGGVG